MFPGECGFSARLSKSVKVMFTLHATMKLIVHSLWTCTRVKVFLFPYVLKDTRESACSKNQKIGKNKEYQPAVAPAESLRWQNDMPLSNYDNSNADSTIQYDNGCGIGSGGKRWWVTQGVSGVSIFILFFLKDGTDADGIKNATTTSSSTSFF